jgi:hypothetical protein
VNRDKPAIPSLIAARVEAARRRRPAPTSHLRLSKPDPAASDTPPSGQAPATPAPPSVLDDPAALADLLASLCGLIGSAGGGDTSFGPAEGEALRRCLHTTRQAVELAIQADAASGGSRYAFRELAALPALLHAPGTAALAPAALAALRIALDRAARRLRSEDRHAPQASPADHESTAVAGENARAAALAGDDVDFALQISRVTRLDALCAATQARPRPAPPAPDRLRLVGDSPRGSPAEKNRRRR